MEPNESRSLNPLEAFLLQLVEHGLTSPYDLLSKAGLGAGLTSPVLKRLQQAGLLTSVPGPRKRLRYALTEKGKKILRDVGRPPFWQQGQGDVFESSARGIILDWLHSGADEAKMGLMEGAYKLSVVARKRQRDAEELQAAMVRLQAEIVDRSPVAAKGMLIAVTYKWLKAECDALLFRLQEQATAEIIKLVDHLPPANLVQVDKDGIP